MAWKVLMVDVDGVVVRRPSGLRWDHRMKADLGLDPETLQQRFFAPHFQAIVTGQADLFDRLTPILAEIAPHLTSKTLVEYWFAQDGHLDETLLTDLAGLRASGVPMHLATVQEHHRARHLWDVLRLRDRFDAIHYAADYGVGKPDPAFFRAVEARTGFEAADLFLLDDSVRNVEAARGCGWGAALWDGSRPLAEVLTQA